MTTCIQWWYGALRLTLFNQASALAEKPIFRNFLVAMRPKTTRKDLPSRHNIEVYIYNKFVDWLKILKTEILVGNKTAFLQVVLTFIHRKPSARSHQLQMGGQQTTQKGHFWG